MKKLLLSAVAFLFIGNLSAQNVNIPDANLKAALVNQTNPIIDSNGDGEIQVSEALAVTGGLNSGSIRASNAGIADATGLEAFINATYLDVRNNSLTSLGISALTQLKSVKCEGNSGITALDVTSLVNLEFLTCQDDSISTLDVSQNLVLEYLTCSNTQISSLDVTNNSLLETLYAASLSLTSIDLSQNTALRVANVTYNQLTSLDVSQNVALQQLRCNDNQLTSMDVSQNPSLTLLEVTRNMIDSLDLSSNVNLTTFGAYSNALTYLNLNNGNNVNMSAITVGTNPDLYCITVDDSLYSETTWRSVYPVYLGVGNQTVFNGNCNSACFVYLRTNMAVTACLSYSFNGQILSGTGIYIDTLNSVATCKDSIVKLDLTINNVDTGVSQTGNDLIANASGATYQWLDCNNSNGIISSETNQTYTAAANGGFAVEITQNGCVDTSACVNVVITAIQNSGLKTQILSIYPNPTNGQFSIDLGEAFKQVNIQILDLSGRVVYQTTTNKQVVNLNFEAPKGIYFVSINTGLKQSTIKLIKQ
jgi:hypothetical protein